MLSPRLPVPVLLACFALLSCGSATPSDPAPVDAIEPELEQVVPVDLAGRLAWFVADPGQVQALERRLDENAVDLAERLAAHGGAPPERVRELLERQVDSRLAVWVDKDRQQDLPVDAERIRRQVLDWEAFKLERYVSSGVFPKTWFGYFDLAWDSADRERSLRGTTVCTRRIINSWQEERGSPVRVTDAEVALTFIAEGGALLLREQQHMADRLHPVFDVGLDDLASGLGDYQGLLDGLDEGCGTDLAGTVLQTEPGVTPEGALGRLQAPDDRWAWLVRHASFREAIVGTALMWIWEKEIAQRKLLASGRQPLHQRDAAQQFVLGSLVYNSGLIHAESTAQQLLRFQSGGYLYERSEANARRRPRLNLLAPGPLLEELLSQGSYREQPTSWVAVYHVLQRYGAWEGLRLFSDVFDAQGMFQPVADFTGEEAQEPSSGGTSR